LLDVEITKLGSHRNLYLTSEKRHPRQLPIGSLPAPASD
jgi:hypothetical protein